MQKIQRGFTESRGEVDSGLREAKQFVYVDDMLDSNSGCKRALQTHAAAAWKIQREITGLLINQSGPESQDTELLQAIPV